MTDPRKPTITILSGDPADVELIAATLKGGGLDVTIPKDEAEALAEADGGASDLIVLDPRSASPSGATLLEKLAAREGSPPILAITSAERLSDHLAQRGIAGVLVKPLERGRILSHVQAVLEGNAPDEAKGGAPDASPQGEKPLILIVDDEPDMQMLLSSLLAHNGFDTATAANGMEGLKAVQQRRPSAIILDIMLPKLDGFQMCRLIKFNEKFRDIPVIMLTARNHPKDKELAEASGADDFIVKPFDSKSLIERLQRATR